MTFEAFGLHQPILRAVVAEGYTAPTPIQAQSIAPLLEGRDLLGCAQTGTGKTAAFALPILHALSSAVPPKGAGRKIRALALAPTRELASQIGQSLGVYGRHTPLRHTVIYGGVGQFAQVKALRHGVDILVATPGRLMDLMQQGHIDLSHVSHLVIDEADRMFDMGFLPDLRRIVSRLPTKRQNIFFSATMPPAIEELANSILRDAVRVRIEPAKVSTDLVEQSVRHVAKQNKSRLLVSLIETDPVERAIVFTRTKRGADRVARQLNQSGIRAEAMHGDKSQSARERTIAKFKGQHPPVLVATDVAARGLHVDAVSHVFNYDLPHEAETYVHRIGRTGRAGATGIAVSFCDAEERGYLKAIERLLRKRIEVDGDQDFDNSPSAEAGEARQGDGANRGVATADGRFHAKRPKQFKSARRGSGRRHSKPHAKHGQKRPHKALATASS